MFSKSNKNELAPPSQSRSLLHDAAEFGLVENISLLITQLSTEINACDVFGSTPLYYAVVRKHSEIVRLLLDAGANPISTHVSHDSALHTAASNGLVDIVKLMYKKDASVINTRDINQETPLHRATANGHMTLCEAILQLPGVDKNAMDKNGRTPLFAAYLTGNSNLVSLFISSQQTDLDLLYAVGTKDDKTLLHIASDGGDTDLTQQLLSHGANANVRDKFGQTALHIACDRGHLKIAQMLLRAGAEVDLQDQNGLTALHRAVSRCHERLVRLLVGKGGADVNIIDLTGATPLYKVMDSTNLSMAPLFNSGVSSKSFYEAPTDDRRTNIVFTLLDAKADPNIQNMEERQTLLHWACRYDERTIAELLLASGADPNLQDQNGQTPLFHAADKGHDAMLTLLVDSGKADVNIQDVDSRTALHVAASSGVRHSSAVETLVRAGCNLRAVDSTHKTALEYAQQFNHLHSAEILEKALVMTRESENVSLTDISSEVNDLGLVAELAGAAETSFPLTTDDTIVAPVMQLDKLEVAVNKPVTWSEAPDPMVVNNSVTIDTDQSIHEKTPIRKVDTQSGLKPKGEEEEMPDLSDALNEIQSTSSRVFIASAADMESLEHQKHSQEVGENTTETASEEMSLPLQNTANSATNDVDDHVAICRDSLSVGFEPVTVSIKFDGPADDQVTKVLHEEETDEIEIPVAVAVASVRTSKERLTRLESAVLESISSQKNHDVESGEVNRTQTISEQRTRKKTAEQRQIDREHQLLIEHKRLTAERRKQGLRIQQLTKELRTARVKTTESPLPNELHADTRKETCVNQEDLDRYFATGEALALLRREFEAFDASSQQQQEAERTQRELIELMKALEEAYRQSRDTRPLNLYITNTVNPDSISDKRDNQNASERVLRASADAFAGALESAMSTAERLAENLRQERELLTGQVNKKREVIEKVAVPGEAKIDASSEYRPVEEVVRREKVIDTSPTQAVKMQCACVMC